MKGTDTLCADYIEGMMSDFTCTPFTGVLSWKACNNNERVIHVQKSSSNRAFSTNNKIKGRFEKDKEELNDNIAAKTCYQPETKEKEINPCQPNTIQINLLGRQFNTEIPTHRFRDKDCHSFTFLSLPIIDPNAETSSVPSVMDSNVPSMTLSNEPSVKASNNPSATASSTPSVVDSNVPSMTVSNDPSVKATSNPSATASSTPSLIASSKPSVKAISNPSATASSTPSAVDSNVPSENPLFSPIGIISTKPPTPTPSLSSVVVTKSPAPSLSPLSVLVTKPPHPVASPSISPAPTMNIRPTNTKSPKTGKGSRLRKMN